MFNVPDELPSDGPPLSAGKRLRDQSHHREGVAEVFGDVLPETTSDEREAFGDVTEGGRDAREDEMLRDVPPHH